MGSRVTRYQFKRAPLVERQNIKTLFKAKGDKSVSDKLAGKYI